MDDDFDRIEVIEDGLAFVEVGTGGVLLVEAEADGGERGEREDMSVLGGRLVDTGGEGLEEGEAIVVIYAVLPSVFTSWDGRCGISYFCID